MGSVQSYLSSQTTTVVLVVAGVVTYTVAQKILQHQFQSPSPHVIADSGNISVSGNSTGKKSKKKKHATGSATHPSTAGDLSTNVQPTVVAFPEVIPGGFEPSQSGLEAEPSEGPKSSSIKPKKKKGKKTGTGAGGSRNLTTDVQSDSSATAPESHISSSSRPKRKSPAPKPTPPSTSLLDTDGPWTRVESKKRNPPQQQDQLSTSPVGEGPSGGGVVTTSDAGITTSVTGNSSSVADPTEDESQPRQGSPENRRTLAEKLVPKPRKTGVDELSLFRGIYLELCETAC